MAKFILYHIDYWRCSDCACKNIY